MKIKSAILTEASGSIGGLTASHNRGGLYFRARVVPVNPNTPQQQAIRSFVAQLTSLWNDVLTDFLRASWDVYALNVPLPDRLGEPRNVGGLAMYVRSNVPRLQVGLPRVDTGPAIYNLGDYTAPTFAAPIEAGQTVSVGFAETDAWVSEDDSAMLFFGSRPQNPAINFFKGPYRTFPGPFGEVAVPPTSPVVTPLPFAFVTGQKIFFRANVTRADGRLGTATFAVETAVAAFTVTDPVTRPLQAKKRKKKS